MLGFLALNTICLSIYRQLDYVAYGLHRSFLLTCCEEGAGGLAGLLVFPLIYLAAVRFPLLSPRWRFYLPVHLGALCTISFGHTTFIAGIRAACCFLRSDSEKRVTAICRSVTRWSSRIS